MLKFSQKFNFCQEHRLVFKGEKAPEGLSESDQKKGKEVLDEAAKKAREKAIQAGKAKAAPGDKTNQPSNQPAEKPKVPEIPTKIAGLRFDLKEAKTPTPPNGTIEQPFQFGDLKIKGKITFPDKPDNGPNAKTSYIFNYVDDPNKFDNAKFLEKLKDKKVDLGNTVIITIRTPEGETKINQEKVNTMEKLMADVEKYQADLSKDPRFANVKMPRATNVFQMSSYADMEKAKRANDMLAKSFQKLKDSDERWLKHPGLLDSSTPETFAASLDQALAPPVQPDQQQPGQQPDQNPQNVPVYNGGGASPKYGGGGNPGGAGGSTGGNAAPSNSAGGQTTDSPGGDSSGASGNPSPNQAPSENKERGPGVNKLLVLGDSLMIGTKDKLRANSVEKSEETVKGGRQLSEMLSRLKKWDAAGKLEEFRNETMVIDGGTNDLARLKTAGGGDLTQETIFGYMQEVWQIAKKYNIKVFECAIPPFGGTSYKSLGKDFQEKDQARVWLNEQMRKMKGGDGPADIIGLDLPKSQGGMADDADPSRLAAEYRSGDGIHFTGKGYENMAVAIQKVIGEPQSPDQPKDSNVAIEKSSSGLVPYRESTADYNNWAASINQQFIDSGTQYGTTKVVEYNGKKLIAKFTVHNLQAATGKTGTFQATETYEYNPVFDPAEKKRPEILKPGLEKFQLADGKVEGLINIPENFDSSKPTELVIFATPNSTDTASSNGSGNFIGAQAQELRASSAYNGKNLVIAYLTPKNINKWPNFLGQSGLSARTLMDQAISQVKSRLSQNEMSISVEGHSGGGSFIFNMIDRGESIPDYVNQINFYDAIYAYNGIKHAQKIKQWLDSNPAHRFINIAATPQIKNPQAKFITDLQSLGVNFEQIKEADHLTTLSAFAGRLKFTTMSEPDHGGAIKRNSFAYAHNPDQFIIAPVAQREQTYAKLSQIA